MSGMGCSDPPANGKCAAAVASIKINGVEKSAAKPGLNVVVYSYPDGGFYAARDYNTGKNAQASASLAKFINGLSKDRYFIVLVASQGNFVKYLKEDALLALVNPPFHIQCCIVLIYTALINVNIFNLL